MKNPGPRNIIGFILLSPALMCLALFVYFFIVHTIFQHDSAWAWQWFGDFGRSQLPTLFGLMSLSGVYCLVRVRKDEQ